MLHFSVFVLEESYLMSLSSSEEFGGEIIKTWKDIATAVYLDDAKNLKIFITNSKNLNGNLHNPLIFDLLSKNTIPGKDLLKAEIWFLLTRLEICLLCKLTIIR
jgi:hypothetical protein